MRFIFGLIFFIALDVNAETVCVDKNELTLAVMLKEIEAERKIEIFHILDKIDLIIGFVEYGGEVTQERYDFYDRMIQLYLSSILSALSAAEEKGISLNDHKNRLSQNLKDMQKLYKLYPVTIGSEEYQKLTATLSAL